MLLTGREQLKTNSLVQLILFIAINLFVIKRKNMNSTKIEQKKNTTNRKMLKTRTHEIDLNKIYENPILRGTDKSVALTTLCCNEYRILTTDLLIQLTNYVRALSSISLYVAHFAIFFTINCNNIFVILLIKKNKIHTF